MQTTRFFLASSGQTIATEILLKIPEVIAGLVAVIGIIGTYLLSVYGSYFYYITAIVSLLLIRFLIGLPMAIIKIIQLYHDRDVSVTESITARVAKKIDNNTARSLFRFKLYLKDKKDAFWVDETLFDRVKVDDIITLQALPWSKIVKNWSM